MPHHVHHELLLLKRLHHVVNFITSLFVDEVRIEKSNNNNNNNNNNKCGYSDYCIYSSYVT